MTDAKHPTGKFTISVMGRSEEFEIRPSELLSKVSEDALRRSGNPPSLSDWELKTASGSVLAFSLTESQAGIRPGIVLFLSRKIGAGG
jgi:hypothetical protein